MSLNKSNRLKTFDYSNQGYYFLTISTFSHIEIFGKIIENKVILNEAGKRVQTNILNIPKIFKNCELDYFVVMPNHIHLVLIVNSKPENDNSFDRTKMVVSKVIQQFKRKCTIDIKNISKFDGKIWQKSYYDRIIRNDKELYKIRKYIELNPLKWELEKGDPENLDGL